jgi:hypothetical protein
MIDGERDYSETELPEYGDAPDGIDRSICAEKQTN